MAPSPRAISAKNLSFNFSTFFSSAIWSVWYCRHCRACHTHVLAAVLATAFLAALLYTHFLLACLIRKALHTHHFVVRDLQEQLPVLVLILQHVAHTQRILKVQLFRLLNKVVKVLQEHCNAIVSAAAVPSLTQVLWTRLCTRRVSGVKLAGVFIIINISQIAMK